VQIEGRVWRIYFIIGDSVFRFNVRLDRPCPHIYLGARYS
jgi:hypothetical protein